MSRLVNAVYAAGSDPSKWQDFVEKLHALFPRGPTVLYGHDAKADRFLGMLHDGLSPEDNMRFIQHYAAISPFTKAILNSPLSQPQRTFELCGFDRLRTTEYFNDFMLPRKGGRGAAMVLYRQESRSLFLTCECDFRRGDEAELQIVDAMRLLSGHMMQSFDMMRRLSGQKIDRANVDHMINLVRDAAYVLDAKRRVLTMNPKAAAMMKAEKSAGSKRGELLFADMEAQQFLLEAFADIENSNLDKLTSTHFIHEADGRKIVSVCPLAAKSHDSDSMIYEVVAETLPFAVVVVTDIDQQSSHSMALASRLFGLTTAESKLAAAMAVGDDLQHYADTNGLSIHTVRNQLKSIFSKTDTSRQLELGLLINKISNVVIHQDGER
jgi:DNA-binding CsgD family transcriptional regulator